MECKINKTLVRHGEKITTIGELADEGLIEFKEIKFSKRGGGFRVGYFADMLDGSGGWEISKTAYLSRTNQKEELKNMF